MTCALSRCVAVDFARAAEIFGGVFVVHAGTFVKVPRPWASRYSMVNDVAVPLSVANWILVGPTAFSPDVSNQ